MNVEQGLSGRGGRTGEAVDSSEEGRTGVDGNDEKLVIKDGETESGADHEKDSASEVLQNLS